MTDEDTNLKDLYNWTNNSVIDLEKELMSRRAKLLLQLKDPILYREFMEFMSSSKSTRFVLILNLVYTFLFSPPIILNLVFGGKRLLWVSCVEGALIGLAVLSGWLLYACMKENSFFRRRFGSIILSWTSSKSWKKVSDQIQAVLYLSLVLALSVMMIRRTLEGECEKTSFLQIWSCNPSATYSSYPLDSASILMGIPLLFSCVMRETRIWLSVMMWLVVLFTLVYCACLVPSLNSLFAVLFYAIVSFVIMLDSFQQYLLQFMLSRQLKGTIETNQRVADQNKATEMRHLIANVAHDLKTPLSSFMSGIDLISGELTDLIEKIHLAALDSSREITTDHLSSFISDLQSHISNIRNTNSFMLMTINRCLDYTKAAGNLKLAPKYETMELADVLQMPLQCMTNIQQRIKISLLPYTEQGICSHIITDKQWLQENLLCLLSNAVKYSAGGEVSVTVKKIKKVKKEDRRLPSDIQIKPLDRKVFKQPSFAKEEESWFRSATNWVSNSSHRTYTSMKMAFSSYIDSQSKIVPSNSPDIEQPEITIISPRPSLNSPQKIEEYSESAKTMTEKLSLESAAFKQIAATSPTNHTEGEELLFEVTDSGIGVPEEAMKTLFNPFRQTQRLAGGTGLGLYSLAKRIETLKGSYGIRDRDDGKQGSVFWFTIPYKPDLLTAAHAISSADEIVFNKRRVSISFDPAILHNGVHQLHVPRRNALHELQILLAEDTLSIAKMTKLLLHRQRHQVTVAENGQIALDLLSEKKYDVVLMDLQMPVMDGLEATRRIRARERERSKGGVSEHQIVIGVSANSDSETMEEGLKAGIDDFLPKPFSIEAFSEIIQKIQRIQRRYAADEEPTVHQC